MAKNRRSKCIICRKKCKKTYCSIKCKNAGVRLHAKFYSEHNPEHHKEVMRKNYQENKEERKIYSNLYHKEKIANQDYNRTKKNEIREKIIELIKNMELKKILTLESKDYLFSKELPNNKIYVYEEISQTYRLMKINKPNNVSLFYGEISEFKDLEIEVDCVYLDFCNVLFKNEYTIIKLKEVINKSKLFGISLSPRGEDSVEGDYKFFIIKKIQELIGTNWQIVFGESYKDEGHAPMITIFFRRTI